MTALCTYGKFKYRIEDSLADKDFEKVDKWKKELLRSYKIVCKMRQHYCLDWLLEFENEHSVLMKRIDDLKTNGKEANEIEMPQEIKKVGNAAMKTDVIENSVTIIKKDVVKVTAGSVSIENEVAVPPSTEENVAEALLTKAMEMDVVENGIGIKTSDIIYTLETEVIVPPCTEEKGIKVAVTEELED